MTMLTSKETGLAFYIKLKHILMIIDPNKVTSTKLKRGQKIREIN